jgi:hypothetical protein
MVFLPFLVCLAVWFLSDRVSPTSCWTKTKNAAIGVLLVSEQGFEYHLSLCTLRVRSAKGSEPKNAAIGLSL